MAMDTVTVISSRDGANIIPKSENFCQRSVGLLEDTLINYP